MTTIDIHKLREDRSAHELEDAFAARDFDRADQLARERLQEAQARDGEHADVANALADVALALEGRGDLVGAAEAALAALELEERLFGPAHARVGEALHRLAQLQLDARNLDDALTLFQRALTVLEAAAGEADPRVAVVCSGLASVASANGDLDGAAKALEHALQCLALAHGPENGAMSDALDALAQVREAQGLFKDALVLRERAVRICERQRQETLPRAQLGLARAYVVTGNLARARTVVEAALANEAHHTPSRGEAHALLGEIFERDRDFVRARDQYRAALETYRVAFPQRHPQIGVALMNVATLEVALGEVERAEPLARDALTIFLDALGPMHPHTRQMREGLRHAFLDSGCERIAAELAELGAAQ